MAERLVSPKYEAMEGARNERRERMRRDMETALADAAELARNPGPYTWSIQYHDGLFYQFHDANGKPCLGNDVREAEDAAWLLTMLNRPYTTAKE